MIILPAIDILDQQPVRLYQGDYEQKECVGDSIGDIAKAFEQQGARYVHMVDLNGAKEGKKINQDIIVKTAQSLQIPVWRTFDFIWSMALRVLFWERQP